MGSLCMNLIISHIFVKLRCQLLFLVFNIQGITQVNVQVRWHPHKHILAFISSPNQVTIYDYDDSGCDSFSPLKKISIENSIER